MSFQISLNYRMDFMSITTIDVMILTIRRIKYVDFHVDLSSLTILKVVNKDYSFLGNTRVF